MNNINQIVEKSPLTAAILPLLLFSQKKCHKDFLVYALATTEEQLAASLHQLESLKIVQPSGNFYYLKQSISQKDIITCINAFDSNNPFFILLRYFFDANICSMCSTALKLINSIYKQKKFKELRFTYDIIVKYFTACHPSIKDTNCCKFYIDTSYKLLNIFGSFPFILRRSLTWYFKVYSLAIAISYNNHGSTISAAPGYLIANHLEKIAKIFYYDYILNKNKSKTNSIDDIKLSPYKSIRNFIDGDFIKSINCVYAENNKKIDFSYFSRTLYVFSACSAMYIGEYEVCITMLKMGKRHAEQVGNYIDAESLHSMMAYIYVHTGNIEEAKKIISAILNKINSEYITYAELWAIRALTILHYRNGDIQKAYATYKKYLEYAVTNDILHIGYVSSSLILEIMTTWQIAGYQHPFGGDLYAEIRHAQTSASRVLRHIALRCEIELSAAQEGWGSKSICRKITTCMEGLKGLTTPVLSAKAMICVARFARAVGKEQEARRSMQEVAEVCRRYGAPILPPDVEDLLDDSDGLRIMPHPSQAPVFKDIPNTHDDGFIVKSSVMQEILKKVSVLAPRDTSVLILGESGVGKEHIARQLHKMSCRKGKFVAVNLSSLPGELFESEFYGYEKGSFTGAATSKEGLLELADGGTLFLDEVGDIPLSMQVKLLRVLQEKNFMRVGGVKLKKSDFRIISATNKDLEEAVRNGTFREDLYYRINVFPLKVPPLRKRKLDIISIAKYYLEFFLAKFKLPSRNFSDDDIKFLTSYRWPGNVRELRNYIERYVFLSDSERVIDHHNLLYEALSIYSEDDYEDQQLPEAREDAEICKSIFDKLLNSKGEWITGKAPTLDEIKNSYIEFMFIVTNGVISGPGGLADRLGVSKVTAYSWVEKLKLKEKYKIQIIKKES